MCENAGQQRDAVSYREQTDVRNDVFQPVEEEDHADKEKKVIVPVTICLAPRYRNGPIAHLYSIPRRMRPAETLCALATAGATRNSSNTAMRNL
jgi:hypothetical protein